ncbi:unnamed protein product [Trichogramma brassicae]|uniref:Uncharacterized protein n=1 Tax=Trichogramma brassicae TaxID=86971 RepID=A0A6H5IBD2_9HYME|nr:unnamed protein product [Trichogramma brassicae]
MAVDTKVSLVLSSIVTLLLFSGMQIYKPWLISTKLHVVIAGYIGSMVFLFSLTALGNLETILFGRSFQVKFIPEEILFKTKFSTQNVNRKDSINVNIVIRAKEVHQTHRSAEATSRPWSAAPPSTMVHDDDDNNNNERRHREGFVLITESQLDKGGGVGVRVTVVCSTESRDAE